MSQVLYNLVLQNAGIGGRDFVLGVALSGTNVFFSIMGVLPVYANLCSP